MFHITNCPICGKQDFKTQFTCTDHTVSHETFSIVSCVNCQFLITDPRPDTSNLEKYYLSENYISHSTKSRSIIDLIYRISRVFTLNWKVTLVKETIGKNIFSLLDYGCGAGDFLQACERNKLDVNGVEPSTNASLIATEKLAADVYSDISEIIRKYDAITMWHVLEHIPDLIQRIQELKERLQENGIIFIAVPNHQSYDALKFKHLWAAYDVPRHLWHFSKDTMKQLLETNGLTLHKIVPMKLDSFYVSILSNKYARGKTTVTGFLSGVITGLISNMRATKNNNYSSLIYIATKK